MRGMDFACDFKSTGSYACLGSVTVSIRVCLGEELCRIRSEDVFTVLISCENIHHMIYFFQRGQIMCFILGLWWWVFFFFYKYKESFACVVTADMSVHEHLFYYGTDLLLLLANSGKAVYGQMSQQMLNG